MEEQMSRKGQFKTYCKRGHERNIESVRSNGTCKECQKACNKTWVKANPDKVKVALQKHRSGNPKKYGGWTTEAVEEAGKRQRNCCAICHKTFDRTPCADHDHITNTPRELLCDSCNKAIGFLQDSAALCEAAAVYLRKWGK
jgi:hypothetical protein